MLPSKMIGVVKLNSTFSLIMAANPLLILRFICFGPKDASLSNSFCIIQLKIIFSPDTTVGSTRPNRGPPSRAATAEATTCDELPRSTGVPPDDAASFELVLLLLLLLPNHLLLHFYHLTLRNIYDVLQSVISVCFSVL